MNPQQKRQEPPITRPSGLGCGCAFTGPGYVLLGLTLFLVYVLATTERLRTSPLWVAVILLVLGMAILYLRVHKFKGPKE